jgi:hypothetical protein
MQLLIVSPTASPANRSCRISRIIRITKILHAFAGFISQQWLNEVWWRKAKHRGFWSGNTQEPANLAELSVDGRLI